MKLIRNFFKLIKYIIIFFLIKFIIETTVLEKDILKNFNTEETIQKIQEKLNTEEIIQNIKNKLN